MAGHDRRPRVLTTLMGRSFRLRQVGDKIAFGDNGYTYAIIGVVETFIDTGDLYVVDSTRYREADDLTKALDPDEPITSGARVVGRLIDERGEFVKPRGREPAVMATLKVTRAGYVT